MYKKLFLFLLTCSVVALPFIFRKNEQIVLDPDDVLVVLSPHTEFICDEIGNAFSRWYKAKTGRTVLVDFRHGASGSTETQRYLDSIYDNAFRQYWESALKNPWSYEVQTGYCRALQLDETPHDDTPAQAARRAFLASNIGAGIDVLFGGGTLVFKTQADRGQLVPSTIQQRHPEWFTDAVMPAMWAGDHTRDGQDRWFGVMFSTYGIIYNKDVLRRLGFEGVPASWDQLTDPRFFGQIALCDPGKSGMAKKVFELIIQEQMQQAQAEFIAANKTPAEAERMGIAEGWVRGLRVIQKMAANARYFTDKSTKPALDVGAGDCAAGMILDGYGLAQCQNIVDRGGADRMGFVVPHQGSTLEPDPIGLLRGAPNREVAEYFIEFVLSPEGQKLWLYKTGVPDGPEHYALRRLAIRRDMYEPALDPYRVDSALNPYADAERYTYHASWTIPIFNALHCVIKALCVDPHQELVEAWAAILQAEQQGRYADAAKARAIMEDITGLSYDTVVGPISDTLDMGTPLQAILLQSGLSHRFGGQYHNAASLTNQNAG